MWLYLWNDAKPSYFFWRSFFKTADFENETRAQCNEMLFHWNLLQEYEYNATNCAASKVGCWIPFFFLFLGCFWILYIYACLYAVYCVNAHCILQQTRKYLFTILFSMCFVHCFFLHSRIVQFLSSAICLCLQYFMCIHFWEEKKIPTTTTQILLCTPMYRLWNKYYDICRTLL